MEPKKKSIFQEDSIFECESSEKESKTSIFQEEPVSIFEEDCNCDCCEDECDCKYEEYDDEEDNWDDEYDNRDGYPTRALKSIFDTSKSIFTSESSDIKPMEDIVFGDIFKNNKSTEIPSLFVEDAKKEAQVQLSQIKADVETLIHLIDLFEE